MYKTGHYGAGLLFLAPVVFLLVYFQHYLLAALAAIVILSLTRLPDIDLYLKGVKHRGMTHTLVFAAGMGVITGIALAAALYAIPDEVLNVVPVIFEVSTSVRTLVYAFGFGFILGSIAIIAHLVADLVTPTGLQPLMPFNDERYRYELTRASDPYGNIAFFLIGKGAVLGAVFLALYLAH